MANLQFMQDNMKRIEEEKKQSRRRKMAEYFVKDFNKGSDWFIKENLKHLSLYKDFDFVMAAVEEFAQGNHSDYLRKYLDDFFAGTTDISDIVATQKRFREMREAKQEFLKKHLNNSKKDSSTEQHILLKSLYQK